MDVADCYSLLTLIITPNPDLDLDLDRRAMVITHTYAKVDVKHDLSLMSQCALRTKGLTAKACTIDSRFGSQTILVMPTSNRSTRRDKTILLGRAV